MAEIYKKASWIDRILLPVAERLAGLLERAPSVAKFTGRGVGLGGRLVGGGVTGLERLLPETANILGHARGGGGVAERLLNFENGFVNAFRNIGKGAVANIPDAQLLSSRIEPIVGRLPQTVEGAEQSSIVLNLFRNNSNVVREALKDSPEILERLGNSSASVDDIAKIFSRLMENPATKNLVNFERLALNVENGTKSITKLTAAIDNALIGANRTAEEISKMNKFIREGKYLDAVRNVLKIDANDFNLIVNRLSNRPLVPAGTASDEAAKVAARADNLIISLGPNKGLIEEAMKVEGQRGSIEGIIRGLNQNGIIMPWTQNRFLSSLNNLTYQEFNRFTRGAIKSVPVAGILGVPTAIGYIFGESAKLITEIDEIINQIIDSLNDMGGNDTWESMKSRIISQINQCKNIDISKITSINPQTITEEQLQYVIDSLSNKQDQSSLAYKISKLEAIFDELLTAGFYNSYSAHSSSTIQDIGETIDRLNIIRSLTGSITDINRVKNYAEKGKILVENFARNCGKKLEEIMKAIENQPEQPAKQQSVATASYIIDNYNEVSFLLKEAKHYDIYDLIQADINNYKKKEKIIKKAEPVTISMVLSFLWWSLVKLGIANMIVNIIVKGYIKFTDCWDNLKTNIAEIKQHLQGFITAAQGKPEAKEFIDMTNAMINDLDQGWQILQNNFPGEIAKLMEGDVKKYENDLRSLVNTFVDGKNKLSLMVEGIDKINAVYEKIQRDESYYKQFDKHSESIWHSLAESWELTRMAPLVGMLVDTDIIAEYDRMKYKAGKGQALLAEIKTQISNINSATLEIEQKANQTAQS